MSACGERPEGSVDLFERLTRVSVSSEWKEH